MKAREGHRLAIDTRIGRRSWRSWNVSTEYVNPRKVAEGNQDLFFVKYLTIAEAANILVLQHAGKGQEGRASATVYHSRVNAPAARYVSSTQKNRQACNEERCTAKLEKGQDPEVFFFAMDALGARLHDIYGRGAFGPIPMIYMVGMVSDRWFGDMRTSGDILGISPGFIG